MYAYNLNLESLKTLLDFAALIEKGKYLLDNRAAIEFYTYSALWNEIQQSLNKISPELGKLYIQLYEMKKEMRKQLDDNVSRWNTFEAMKLLNNLSEAQHLEQSKIFQDKKLRLSQDLGSLSTTLQRLAGTVDVTEAVKRLNAIWAPLRLLVRPQEKIEELQKIKEVSQEEATVLVYIESLNHFPPIDISQSQETSQICKNIGDLIKPYLTSQLPSSQIIGQKREIEETQILTKENGTKVISVDISKMEEKVERLNEYIDKLEKEKRKGTIPDNTYALLRDEYLSKIQILKDEIKKYTQTSVVQKEAQVQPANIKDMNRGIYTSHRYPEVCPYCGQILDPETRYCKRCKKKRD